VCASCGTARRCGTSVCVWIRRQIPRVGQYVSEPLSNRESVLLDRYWTHASDLHRTHRRRTRTTARTHGPSARHARRSRARRGGERDPLDGQLASCSPARSSRLFLSVRVTCQHDRAPYLSIGTCSCRRFRSNQLTPLHSQSFAHRREWRDCSSSLRCRFWALVVAEGGLRLNRGRPTSCGVRRRRL